MADTKFYEVERLMAKRKDSSKRVQYLVRWKGYSKKGDTWEPLSNLRFCTDLVQAFNDANKQTRSPTTRSGSSSKLATKINETTDELNQSANRNRRPLPISAPPTQNGRTYPNRKTTEQRPETKSAKSSSPRMIQPLIRRRRDVLTNRSTKRSRSYSPAPRSQNKHPRVEIKSTSINLGRIPSFHNKDNSVSNGFFHTRPPSKDHEYFSPPYKGYLPSWREKRGETPSTSGSDDIESGSKTGSDDCDIIIDSDTVEVPCNKVFTISGIFEKTSQNDSSLKIMDEEAFGRKLTLRGGISRSKYLHVLRRGNCLEIIFCNEAKNNAFTPEILNRLSQLLEDAASDSSSLVLFSSVGDYFSSGFDVKYLVQNLSSAANIANAAKHCAASIRNFINCLIDFPKPIVAMVQGPAIGLGCSILPHFDTVYSSDRAYYSTPYVEQGQTPDGCSSFLFPQILGHSMANDLLLNGTTLTAIEAKAVGLISDVYLHDSLKRNVLPILKSLSLKSPEALIATKELIRNPQRSRLKYINQCEYTSLKQRWSDRETLQYMTPLLTPFHHGYST